MDTREQIFHGVKNVIAKTIHIEPDEVVLTAALRDDLKADSLDAIEIVMALEEEFGITFSEAAASQLKTVDDLVGFIESARTQSASAAG